MSRFVDRTGLRYGNLVVLNREFGKSALPVMWLCKCDCGNTKIVRGNDLQSGRTLSCGCRRKTNHRRTHNMTRTRLYRIWNNIKSRCTNKNVKQYKDYGLRGIKLCDEWFNSFETFRDWALSNGYADDLTIDRIDVNGDYCPENCRWATRKEQSINRTDNHWLTWNGETKTIAEWSAITKIHRTTIESRLKAGLSIEQALTKTPQ